MKCFSAVLNRFKIQNQQNQSEIWGQLHPSLLTPLFSCITLTLSPYAFSLPQSTVSPFTSHSSFRGNTDLCSVPIILVTSVQLLNTHIYLISQSPNHSHAFGHVDIVPLNLVWLFVPDRLETKSQSWDKQHESSHPVWKIPSADCGVACWCRRHFLQHFELLIEHG